MKVTVSRKAHFNAAHRLYRSDWDDEEIILSLVNVQIKTFMAITMN